MTGTSAGRIPEISVLMCVRDGEKFLAEAIESILGQTFEEFEFIIVNDGSTDGTAEILERYSCEDPRIKIIEIANLTEPLIMLRKHGAQVTKAKTRDITQHRVSAVMDYFLRKSNISIKGAPDDEVCTAVKILAVYEMQPSGQDLRAINANAIRFFRKAELGQEMSEKLDTAIITASNLRERLKHFLYKVGL